jgi:hypothetical protein
MSEDGNCREGFSCCGVGGGLCDMFEGPIELDNVVGGSSSCRRFS